MKRRRLAVERLELRWLLALEPATLFGDSSLVAHGAVAPPPPTLTTMIDNGPSSNRVDIVFLGDGYTSSQIESQYVAHIEAELRHMFEQGEDPLPRYNKFFDVHRINVISIESGADVPPEGIFRDTALDAKYYFDGVTERLLYVNEGKANSLLYAGLAGHSFTAEMRLITVNDTRYGGGGGSFAVYAGGNAASPEVALHELGHSFSGLADEYDYGDGSTYTGFEPSAVNVTKSDTGDKWADWLGYVDPAHPSLGPVGAFEGARYNSHGIYRPTETSKMRALHEPFNAISREKIIRDIYRFVDPLDHWTSNAAIVAGANPELSVSVIDPQVIKVEWLVDGVSVPGAVEETFSPAENGFDSGTFTVTARAYDPTDWVRGDRSMLEQTVSWTVHIAGPGSGNVTAKLVPAGRKSSDLRLEIVGDELFNQIVLDLGAGGGKNSVRISGLNGTKINGLSGPLDFTGITKGVTVRLLDGQDVIRVNGGNVNGVITLDAGLGDDHLVLAASKTAFAVNDAGGIDLFDFSESAQGVKIDLAKSNGGSQDLGVGNSLRLNGQIENLRGSRWNDTLKGNCADNYISGGDGNDTITGGRGGFDLLIGGLGVDRINGAADGNSILIGGSTAYDSNGEALLAILDEWRRQEGGVLLDIDTRISHLTGATTGGLNGVAFLMSAGTVSDDGLEETLTGFAGRNWFFKPPTDKLRRQCSSDRVA